MALMLARVLIAAKLLDLEGFAQFSAGLLVSSSFGMLGCLGVHAVLQRDMPMLIVQGRERRGAILVLQACGLAGFLAIAAAALPIAGWSTPSITTGVIAAGILHGLLQQCFLVVTVESRSRGEPLRFARQMLVRASTVTILGIGAIAITRSPVVGLLVESAATLATAVPILRTIFSRAAITCRNSIKIAWNRLPAMPWRAALTLMLFSLVTFIAQYCDRWIAASLLKDTDFALYSFAWVLPMIGQSIQLIVNAAVFPLIARRHGVYGPGRSYRISAMLSTVIALVGIALIIPVGWIFEAVTAAWLPAYKDAAPLISIFLLVTVLRLSDFWTTFLTIAGHERVLLIQIVFSTIAALALWIWLKSPLTPGVHINSIDVALLAPMVAAANYASSAFTATYQYLKSRANMR